MSKIRIENFGPIKKGLVGKNKFLEFDKVTLLIGNQATGKSSVAKLYSTLSWLEKSLTRGNLKENDITLYNRFIKRHCSYQGIENYFKKNTIIEYIGTSFKFLYKNGKMTLTNLKKKEGYRSPKIMYVPAERNFLSIVENPEQLKYLPAPLYTFLEEFERSKTELNSSVELPINNVNFEYQKQHKISYITGTDFKLKLAEASSGIQSLLPLFLVSKNLAYSIIEQKETNIRTTSLEEKQQKKKSIERILSDSSLSDSLRKRYLDLLFSIHDNSCFINVVEELEQNLFPESQRNLLNKLLQFNNLTDGNKLLITTHSPYLLNYLTLAIKAGELNNSIKDLEAQSKLNPIVPIHSSVLSKEVNIYQLTDTGEIKLLPTYEGIPSDENYLNNSLAETNELFDQLLEIEEDYYD